MLNNKNVRTPTTKTTIACAIAAALALSPTEAILALPVPTTQARAHAIQTAYIGAKKATSIALKIARLANKQYHFPDAELNLDRDGRLAHYGADFEVGNREYEYDINMITGEVICHFVQFDD